MKRLLTITLLILNGNALFAQLAPSDTTFFQAQLVQYENWLDEQNFDALLTPTNIFVDSVLVVTHQLNNTAGFYELIDHYEEDFGESLPAVMMSKLSFIMDISPSQLVIEAESNEAFITIYKNGGKVIIEQEKKMGSGIDENFSLNLDELDQLTHRGYCELDGRSIEFIKKTLIQKIDEFCRPYKTGLFEKYRFKVIDNYEKDLVLEISNVSNVILSEDVFEHIRISLEILTGRKEDELQINLEVYGKYASGIFWAPRNGRYKDMEEKYRQKVEDFAKSFRTRLISFLK